MIDSLKPGNHTDTLFLRAFLAFAILFIASAPLSYAQETAGTSTRRSPLPPPQPFRYVNDYANVMDAATIQRLETILVNLKQRADIEIAVVTVPTTGDLDIFDYSLALARRWGVGSKEGEKNGMLFLIAVNDRKYFTQISRHLEGDITDGIAGQIQRERLVPRLRENKFSQGISDTVETYIATLAEKRGFTLEGIDKSRAYRQPQTRRTPRSGGSGCGLAPCVIIFIILIIFLLLSSNRSRFGGGGCWNLLLLGSLLNSGGRGGGWSSGGWSSGGSSGWGGGGFGGGGGSGGGFGGGGDFGGGGAGGSW